MATDTVLESTDQLPEPPSDILWEFVDGRFVEKHVGAGQNALANDIQDAIQEFLKDRRLGRAHVEMVFDFRKQNGRKRRPDVAFVSYDRWAADEPLPLDRDWEVVPNLAVEVVSPSNSFEEQLEKKNEYFSLSVQQVWIVLPAVREVYIYDSPSDVRLVIGSGTLTAGPVLDGFELPLDKLFGPQKKETPAEQVD